jgi:hypothetical protein
MRRLILLSLAMAALTKPCRPSPPVFSVEQPDSSASVAPLVVTERATTSTDVPPSPEYVRRQVLSLTDAARQRLKNKNVETNARLSFALFDDVTLTAIVRDVESKNEGILSLIAEGENIPAHVTLSYSSDDGMSAFIDMANDGDISIVRYAEEPQRLLANQFPLETPLACSARSRQVQPSPTDADVAAAAARGNRPSQIDVGVMYTQNVLCALAGTGATKCSSEADLRRDLETLVDHASSFMDCSTVKARVNLVGLKQLTHTETGTVKGDLEVFLNTAVRPGKDLLDFRKQYKADIVFVLVSRAVGEKGRAEVFDTPTGPQFANRAIAVVMSGLLYSPELFLHELAHTMGAGHQRPNEGRYSYSRANKFEIEKVDLHTLMTDMTEEIGTRVSLFSGRNLKVKGVKTGSIFRDHVETLDKTRDMVEQFQGGVATTINPIRPCSAKYYQISTLAETTNP